MADKVKFFADKHFSKDAIKELRKRGVDIINSLEAGFDETEVDPVLLEHATKDGRVMVSCDKGFISEHLIPYYENDKPHASVLYFNMAVGECHNVGLLVETILLIYELADPDTETFNQTW